MFRLCTLPSRAEDGDLMVVSVVSHIREGGGSGLGGANGFSFLNHAAGGSLNLEGGNPGLVARGDCLIVPSEATPWPGTGVGLQCS